MSSSEIVPRESGSLAAGRPRSLAEIRTAKRLGRSLTALEATTAYRVANTRADAMVAQEKAAEVSDLARSAMFSQAMLVQHQNALAGADPVLHAELGQFVTLARLGQAEIISDLVGTYCRESRRVR
ncbi:MAG: hypothetical protein QOE45_2508 [Frankiaceae bacterium]|jgi:hypothetical protein|nr:hypothetical protein [Frankiaceae bacterium]